MKKSDVHIGTTYLAKVSGNLVPVTITAERTNYADRTYWLARNTKTGREVTIRSAQRLRQPISTKLADAPLNREPEPICDVCEQIGSECDCEPCGTFSGRVR